MDQLIRHPVHRALTRPQTFGGVTYSFFVINMAVTTELFLMNKSFGALPAAALIHGAGYLVVREKRCSPQRCGVFRENQVFGIARVWAIGAKSLRFCAPVRVGASPGNRAVIQCAGRHDEVRRCRQGSPS